MEGEKKTQKTHHLEPGKLKRKISDEENQEETTKRRHQDIEPPQTSSASDSSTDGEDSADDLQDQEFPLKKRFRVLRYLGGGGFGNVYLMKDKTTKKRVAMKVIKLKAGKQDKVDIEKKVLEEAGDCPFIIQVYQTLQTEKYFWIVMELAPGGDFRDLMDKRGQLDIDSIRFYSAEVILGLRHLHEKGFIHRDIKLENVFIGEDGHVRIADFGLATDAQVAQGYAGTEGCIAPEILKEKEYDAAVDYYSLGVMMFEMATGDPYVSKRSLAFSKMDKVLKDLLRKLLRGNPKKRLGLRRDVRSHPFFREINWADLQRCTIPPPFLPS